MQRQRGDDRAGGFRHDRRNASDAVHPYGAGFGQRRIRQLLPTHDRHAYGHRLRRSDDDHDADVRPKTIAFMYDYTDTLQAQFMARATATAKTRGVMPSGDIQRARNLSVASANR